MMPRRHHVEMKYLLVRMALQNAPRFFDTFGPTGDGAYLRDLWDGLGRSMKEPVDALGLHAALRSPSLLIVTLPSPAASNEAYFIAVLREASQVRVFGLERMARPEGATVLVEFSAKGRAVWSREAVLDVAAFEARLLSLVAQSDAKPLLTNTVKLG